MDSNIVFACFVIGGAIFREYICISEFIKLILGQKVNVVFQILNPIILIGVFFILNLYINFGMVRLYTFVAFAVGYVLYGVTFCKMLENLHKVIYNKLTMIGGIKYTKLGRFILK